MISPSPSSTATAARPPRLAAVLQVSNLSRKRFLSPDAEIAADAALPVELAPRHRRILSTNLPSPWDRHWPSLVLKLWRGNRQPLTRRSTTSRHRPSSYFAVNARSTEACPHVRARPGRGQTEGGNEEMSLVEMVRGTKTRMATLCFSETSSGGHTGAW